MERGCNLEHAPSKAGIVEIDELDPVFHDKHVLADQIRVDKAEVAAGLSEPA